MTQPTDEFLNKLLGTFRIEAQEHLREISSGLLALEQDLTGAQRTETVEAVFREAHSLKGAARAVNLREVETGCQSLESVFAALKRDQSVPPRDLLDILHEAVDCLVRLASATELEGKTSPKGRLAELSQRLESAAGSLSPSASRRKVQEAMGPSGSVSPHAEVLQSLAVERPLLAETVRIHTAKLDSLLRQAEELLLAKLTASQRVAELQELSAALELVRKERAAARPGVRSLQQWLEKEGNGNGCGNGNGRCGHQEKPARPESSLRKVLEYLGKNEDAIRSLQARLTTLARSAQQDHRSLSSMVDSLLEDLKGVLRLPFSSLLEIFPKLVRDLSRDSGKEVDLVIRGGEIEADRRILEEMKDPLIHLVRNCVDHGIEAPQQRKNRNKPSRGTVTIAIARSEGSKVEILVSDDGAGIDRATIRAAGVKLGIISPERVEELDDQQTLSLIFQSGVSTSPVITNISGHGLGLAIVREKAEKLRGSISVETHPEAGTTFRIVLPLTLAAFQGVLVRVSDRLFVVPSTYVERVVRVSLQEVRTVENRETIKLGGQAVSLVRLGDVLELPRSKQVSECPDKLYVIVLTAAEKRIAFVVEAVSGEQEVLVKPLGPQLSRVRNVAAATVLGTGQVVLILNVPDLINSAVRASAAQVRPEVPVEAGPAKAKSILVAEDSITARTLLKNILESAGYKVTTAVDGVDAFTALKTASFDLVVSDVDMPRMSGLDLSAKIRGDKNHSELPIVLVTALESRADRERGIDVGANAYIVKSGFDQSNLLEVIRRLI